MANKWEHLFTEENLAAQIEQARELGEVENLLEPRAETVQIEQGKIVIQLKNGAQFIVSPILIQGLESATPEQLQDFWVSHSGDSIHWESLNVDFSVPGLLAGKFGTKRWMLSKQQEQAKNQSVSSPHNKPLLQ